MGSTLTTGGIGRRRVLKEVCEEGIVLCDKDMFC